MKRKFIPRVIIVVMLFLLVIIGILVIIKYHKEKQEVDLSNNGILNYSDNSISNEHAYVVSDIVCGNIYNNDCRVYVREGGKYIPYLVIKTENYGENTVLLMREDAYPKEMMFRDCNVFGAGGSYYPGSVIDEFMENELYNMYSDGMQSIIKNVPVKIHSKKYISKFTVPEYAVFETINRHVFALAFSECKSHDLLKECDIEGAFIPEVLEFPIEKYVWLRSDAFGGDDTCAAQIYNGKVQSNRVSMYQEQYVRPVFVVSADEQIRSVNSIIKDMEVFVFSIDEE
ncbi:MAG: hypothetical protein IJL20_09085 [Lachnospiraceae bacterium]|nr:hypothetical protein [Lachnospiraceae bacterium]